MASIVARLEEVARVQKETAELLRELARTHDNAASQRLGRTIGRTNGPVQHLRPVQNGLPAQPGPRQAQPRRPASQGRRPTWLAEPLTQQEQTVLWMLATHLSLREIGRELYVSLNTIKSHTRAIYRKLGVSNRHEAIQRGHELAIPFPQLASGDT